MSSDKTRQSSGARSIFSRGKSKDKRTNDAASLAPDSYPYENSRTSRHKRDSSSVSIDLPYSPDPQINHSAGVLTSIPYDGSQTPIAVEYLPKGDQVPVERSPLPHHLNKGGVDFHQYPSFDPANMPARDYGSAPRSAQASPYLSAGNGRQGQYQQWGHPRASTASSANGSYQSLDNASLYSVNPPPHPTVRMSRPETTPPTFHHGITLPISRLETTPPISHLGLTIRLTSLPGTLLTALQNYLRPRAPTMASTSQSPTTIVWWTRCSCSSCRSEDGTTSRNRPDGKWWPTLPRRSGCCCTRTA
uniref:Uncharacterized protein n=1 Tax=Bionectria ochroleuca TaxID=29856 RepID=A0A8H7N3B2_BIOOC